MITPVSRSYYPWSFPFALDRAADQYFEYAIPASSPRTVRFTYTVPAKKFQVLRSVVLKVPRTGTALNVILETTLQRPACPETTVLSTGSTTDGPVGAWRYVTAEYNAPLPPGSTIRFYTQNTGTGVFNTALSLLIDEIDL